MSINWKLLASGLILATIAAGFTFRAHFSQLEARQLVWQIFDQAIDPLAALQAAQSRTDALEERYVAASETPAIRSAGLEAAEAAHLVRHLTQILARLGEAAASLPADGPAARAVDELRYAISRLKATQGEVSPRLLRRELGDIANRFDGASRTLRAEIAELREKSRAGITDAMRTQALGLLATLVAGLAVALYLARGIAAPVRMAAETARSIGENVERPVTVRGHGTFAELFAALAALQAKLAQDRQEERKALAARTARFEEEIARQRGRFEAAIENMSHGFCLLDEHRNLVVANKPFNRMFSHLKPGATAKDLQADPDLQPLFGAKAEGVVVRETPTGEFIEVRRRGTGGSTIITVENVTERQVTSRKIEELSGFDALTGLPNRSRFYEMLEATLKGENRKADVAVLCLDLEGFKAVNTTFGHAAGDALLRSAGERLAGCLGEADLLARVGGDEFAIVQVPRSAETSAEGLADRILSAFEEPLSTGARNVTVGISIGIVPVRARGARPPLDPHLVMQDGELALSQARSDRRGYRVFAAAMRQEIAEQRQLEADLRRALGEGQLELFYQPFVDVDRRAVSGFEALMRWRHTTRGMVSPALFIPLAETTGLIDEIGLWAIETACRQAAGWPDDLIVSVNLSPNQFKSPTLVEDVTKALAVSAIPPRRLQLEVTESLFLDNVDQTLAVLSSLRSLGLTVSMDDFGTGYSSLGYLSKFPFDKIKIDQSFVRDMAKPENAAIVRAVIGLSSAMNMAVIAEGVETREQYAKLCAEGCREMQGYLFGRPRPASELARTIVQVRELLAREDPTVAADAAAGSRPAA